MSHHDEGPSNEDIRWIHGLARRLARDPTMADDLAQEILLILISRPEPSQRPVRSWLTKVARNLLFQHSRSTRSRKKRELTAARPESVSEEPMDVRHEIVQAVARLPEPLRSTIVLRFFSGLSSAEIARRLDVPAATVRVRVRRALARLRRDLERLKRHWEKPPWPGSHALTRIPATCCRLAA